MNSRLYVYVPHPRIALRRKHGPVKTTDLLPRDNAYRRLNARLAVRVTNAVGTMTCAYLFAVIAFLSLPAAIATHSVIVIVSWVAQTFFQLVLLSVIIVGQNIQALASDKRSEQTFRDAEAVLAEAVKIQEHLAAQDEALARLTGGAAGRLLLRRAESVKQEESPRGRFQRRCQRHQL